MKIPGQKSRYTIEKNQKKTEEHSRSFRETGGIMPDYKMILLEIPRGSHPVGFENIQIIADPDLV
jgi:hypothetical protein